MAKAEITLAVKTVDADALADALKKIMHLYDTGDVTFDVRADSSFMTMEKVFEHARQTLEAYKEKQ